jgi:hypothetical protein
MTVINDARQWTMRVQGAESDQFQIRDSTAGATRLIIDSSGRVTTPNQPSFLAVLTGTHTASSVGNNNPIPFSNTAFNIGNHYNTSTFTFTVPVTGSYQFNWWVRINNANTYVHPLMQVNGASPYSSLVVLHTITNTGATTFVFTGRSDVLYLNANDTVRVVQQDSSFTSGTYQGNQCTFSGYLLG